MLLVRRDVERLPKITGVAAEFISDLVIVSALLSSPRALRMLLLEGREIPKETTDFLEREILQGTIGLKFTAERAVRELIPDIYYRSSEGLEVPIHRASSMYRS